MESGIKESIIKDSYSGNSEYKDYHYTIVTNPFTAVMWELHGTIPNDGVNKWVESFYKFDYKGYSGIGVALNMIVTVYYVEEFAPTTDILDNRIDIKDIKVDETISPSTYYEISKNNSELSNKITNLPNNTKADDYIVVGPYKYNASKGDYIRNIEVKRNGNASYEGIYDSAEFGGITNKILILSKTPEGTFTRVYSNSDAKIGYDILTEFYVLVKKDAGITSIDDLKISICREDFTAEWYYFEEIGGVAAQNLMYGEGDIIETEIPLNFKVNLIPPIQVELNKVDTAGAVVNGAQFKIEYDMGVKNTKGQSTETVTVKDGKITFTQAQPQSSESFQARITEVYTPTGYKQLNGEIILKFEYGEKEAKWKVTKQKEPTEKVTIGTISTNTKTGVNVIPVTVENKSIIEKLTLLKTSSVGGNAVAGAKFKLTLTNVASIKNYQIPTTGATQATSKTIFVTTDAKGNIVLEDIEIADLSKNVTIEIEETEAPVGYKKIDGKITVTLKREGNTYTVSETKKDNTVIDDEFQAGKVTLTNHELILNIKDIPVMNLGGIVWAEDEKTGKAPTSSDIYGDGNSEEALGGIKVSLTTLNGETVKDIYGNEVKDVYTSDGNAKATYVNNKGENKTVDLDLGKYMFTNIPAGTNYKVIFEYDGITYNAITTSKENAYINNNCSKIEQEPSRTNFNNMTKTVEGSGDVNKSVVNGGWNINYDINGNKAFYTGIIDPETNSNQYMYGHSFAYLNKKSDWIDTWNKDDGTINTEHYAFDINCGLNKKYFDLNLGTDVESATVKINGNQTTYSYDQILDGKLDEALNKSSDSEIEYNLYLANSDYYYRIADYKVPGEGAIENKYDEEALNKEQIESAKKDSELEVYVTYRIELKNQSTQHDAKVNLVEYHFDDKYAFLQEKNKNIKLTEETNLNNRVLIIDTSDLQINGGETKSLDLTFKVLPDKNGNKCVLGEDYLNQAEIVSYTTGGGLVDADSAPGNAFLDTKENKVRYEDDTDEANGIKIQLKENAERSISGKVFDTKNNNGVNDVIVQLIELVPIQNNDGVIYQYEYIWQETVAGSDTVKTTARNGYQGDNYTVTNSDGEYKFTERIIPGNYIVRFIYGDGRTYDITENTLKYNGEDYKSTYVDYDYNAEWYNTISLNGENSKAVDNEARRLKVMSYAVDVDGNKGKTLNALDNITDADKQNEIITAYKKLNNLENENITFEDVQKAVLNNTWMCAETLKIKMPVDTDDQKDVRDELTVSNGNAPRTEYTQFNNVNFGLMERPKTKLVLEKHITGLTVKPVASGVNLIANATADINKILDATAGETIELEGQQDGLIAIKSGRTNRGTWYLQTDTTELAQGADAYITYTYVIKNESDRDYLNKDLVEFYNAADIGAYANKLSDLEGEVKQAKKQNGYTNGTYISEFYYTGEKGENDEEVLATVEELQETLNPKVSFVNSTTDFTVDKNDTKKKYYDTEGSLQDVSIKESVTSTTGTGKMELNSNDTSKKLVVSVGLSASEIENGGVYDSYIAEVTHYTNAAGRRDQSTPANLSYVHSYDTNKTLEDYNEEDEFWAETFRITKPTGEDKLTAVQIAIISVSAVVILGVGIILIKKFVLKK